MKSDVKSSDGGNVRGQESFAGQKLRWGQTWFWGEGALGRSTWGWKEHLEGALGDTHKPEAILPSLTPFAFERFFLLRQMGTFEGDGNI